jgi:very-short-patch-repair endonuclease
LFRGGKTAIIIGMVKIHNIRRLLDRRKELRENQTPQEEKLWWYLKDKRLGYKFRRQHSVGGYILDFYCKEKRLIIEIDGEVHNTKEAREYDVVRDKFFTELDYKVLRFKNSEVNEDTKKIVEKIKEYLV